MEELGTNKGVMGISAGIEDRREMMNHERTQSNEIFHVNTKEYNWGMDFIQGIERRQT
jgi:hypothetical protein